MPEWNDDLHPRDLFGRFTLADAEKAGLIGETVSRDSNGMAYADIAGGIGDVPIYKKPIPGEDNAFILTNGKDLFWDRHATVPEAEPSLQLGEDDPVQHREVIEKFFGGEWPETMDFAAGTYYADDKTLDLRTPDDGPEPTAAILQKVSRAFPDVERVTDVNAHAVDIDLTEWR